MKKRIVSILLTLCLVLSQLPVLTVARVNANYIDYTDVQLEAFRAMLQNFNVVKDWNIPNLL